ncbi:MAG: ATP-binding protein [Oscillospiraceae bacterium]|nr:ATP-binding protein [Oscillospiraceae bacterium]
MRIELTGRIDSNNAAQVESEIMAQLSAGSDSEVVLDAEKLDYISSAGLRILLRIRKSYPQMRIVNVSSEVYEILETTGFTEMFSVEKAFRVVSIDGCEEIGRGANGAVYRIDRDNVVKVFNNADALADIRHEREVAKLALILGIPTAISYDVVRVGDSYGSVYELLNARSFSKILQDDPGKLDWCVGEYVAMLKKIHGTLVPPGKLPDMLDTAVGWAQAMQEHLPEAAGEKLMSLIKAVPHDDHMIHGDYHTRNLQLQDDEVLLIDMDTLAVGNPIFELGSIFNAFIGFYELDHEGVKSFQGFDFETSTAFWNKALEGYLGTACPHKLREVEDKARIVGYTRLIRRGYNRGFQDSEKGRAELEHWTQELLELLEKTDTLLFDPDELILKATDENMEEVQAFVDERLDTVDCSMKERMSLSIAVEELFINIAHYAYAPDTGMAKVRAVVEQDPKSITITFFDRGKPYDPLSRADPDVTLPAEEREIGGLGVYMVKQSMDEVKYEYRDGQNVLSIMKKL